MEEALRATSADTLKRITDSLAKEMEEKKRQKRLQEEAEEDEEVRRRQVKKARPFNCYNIVSLSSEKWVNLMQRFVFMFRSGQRNVTRVSKSDAP